MQERKDPQVYPENMVTKEIQDNKETRVPLDEKVLRALKGLQGHKDIADPREGKEYQGILDVQDNAEYGVRTGLQDPLDPQGHPESRVHLVEIC